MAENVAWTEITLVGGAGTGAWKKWDQVGGGFAAAETVVLDDAPQELRPNRTTAGAGPGELTVTATAVLVTIASANGADTGVIRVWGQVRPTPNIGGYGAQ